MNYQSPLRFVTDAVDVSDPKTIQRLKRQLLTEFELNNQQPLVRDGISLSKHEALTMFDALTPQTWGFHQQIWANKPLLSFLESGDIPPVNWQQTLPNTTENKPLYAFLLPHYTSRYADALVQAYDTLDQARLRQVLSLPLLHTQQDASLYYRRVTSRLTQQIRHVQEWTSTLRRLRASSVTLKSIRAGLNSYEQQWSLWNELPDYFAPVRDQLALVLGQLTMVMLSRQSFYLNTGWRIYRLTNRINVSPAGMASGQQIKKQAVILWLNNAIRPAYAALSAFASFAARIVVGWFLFVALLVGGMIEYAFFFGDEGSKTSAVPTDSISSEVAKTILEQVSQPDPERKIRLLIAGKQPELHRESAVARPVTGCRVFEPWVYANMPNREAFFNEETLISIENRSSSDVIVCFYDSTYLNLASYYIRVSETFAVPYLPYHFGARYGVHWLAGQDLQPTTHTPQASSPFGFRSPVEVVATRQWHTAPYRLTDLAPDTQQRMLPINAIGYDPVLNEVAICQLLKTKNEASVLYYLRSVGNWVIIEENIQPRRVVAHSGPGPAKN